MTHRPRASALWAILIAGGAGALASCNLLVGSGDYAVGGDDAGDATNGDDVSGSEGGNDANPSDVQDARNDAGADAGGQGDAHADASRESGAHEGGPGDGGGATCGQTLPVGQRGFQTLVSTCVNAVSCDPFYFQVTISDCVTNDYLHAIGSLACLSTITNCTDFYGCRGSRYPTATECPAASTATGTCNSGNEAVNCAGTGAGTGYVQNCTKLGGSCGTYVSGSGTTVADCVVLPSCSDTDASADHCSNNKLYSCNGSKGYGLDCTTINASCTDLDGGGGPSCYFNAPACSPAGYACNSGGLDWCTSAGQHFTYDCTRAGLTCSVDDAGVGSCTAPDCPVPSTCTESCGMDNNTLTLCVGGARYDVDCKQIGFAGGCSSSTQSSTGVTFNYCAM